MKRIFFTLVLLFACLAIIFANGSKETSDDKAGTQGSEKFNLVFWGGVPADFGPNQLIAAYKEMHPNIEIEYELLGWDDASDVKLITALMSGTGVDVYIPTRGNLQKAEQGVALDLTPFLEKDGIDLLEVIGPDADSYQYNSKFYNIPTVRFTTTWMLNLKKFEEAGIAIPDTDWTIDEFMEISKALTSGEGANKTYGSYITSNWGNYWKVLSGGYSEDKDYFNVDFTESKFNSPLMIDTLERYLKLTEVYKSMPTYAECVAENYAPGQMLLTEKAAMVACAQYILRDVKNVATYPRDFKVGFATVPLNPDFPGAYSPSTLQDPIMINPKSKYIDESWEFVKWYFQEGIAFMIPGGRTPAYNKFDSNEVADIFIKGYEDIIDKDSFINVFAKQTRPPARMVQTVKVSKAYDILAQYAEEAIVGNKTVVEALDEAKKASDKILNE